MTPPPFELASFGLLLRSVNQTFTLIHHLRVPLTDISRFHVDTDLDISFDTPHGTICTYHDGRRVIGLCPDATLEEGHPDVLVSVTSPEEYAALRRPQLTPDDGEITLHRAVFVPLAQAALRVQRRNTQLVHLNNAALSAMLAFSGLFMAGQTNVPAGLLLAAAVFAAISAAQAWLLRRRPEFALTLLRLTGLVRQRSDLPAELPGAADINALLRAQTEHHRQMYHGARNARVH